MKAVVSRKPRRSQGYLDGLQTAITIAQTVMQEWQDSDNPDWHGGVAASKEIAEKLQKIAQGGKCDALETSARSLSE